MMTTFNLPDALLPARIIKSPLEMLTLLMLFKKSVTYKNLLVLSMAIPLGAEIIYQSESNESLQC